MSRGLGDVYKRQQVESGEHEKEIFYTALYHTMIQPNVMSDANGEYMAADYSVRRLPVGQVHYSTFSLWDTFRAAHPLYTMLEPERSTDFVNSMIRQYDYYGYLPIWQLWGQDNYCMIGNHAVPVVVDAILKGLPGIDVDKAYEAVKMSLTTPHLNSPFEVWDQYGYMPEDLQTQSVSITLEQSFDDWCAAQLAKHLNKAKDYEFFMKRSAYYRNLHHPETKFFQPKNSKGEWILPFDPYKYGANGGYPFTEGNGWQYTFFAPQDPYGLIALFGGDKPFTTKLDGFFTNTDSMGEGASSDITGLIGQYAHGNEPSHHVAYLYAYAGEQWKTAEKVRFIMSDFYTDQPDGIIGNEDCGQMSAWYLLSSMGLYQVNPSDGVFVFGSPCFKKVEVKVRGGNTFTVEAPNNSKENIYIQKVYLNGKPYDKSYITYQDIINGSTLKFVMGKKPNKNFGKAPANRPVVLNKING